MLSPEFIFYLAEKAEYIAEQLHNSIVNRIVSRFIKQMSKYNSIKVGATMRWQMEVLKEAGYLYEDVQKEIAKKAQLEYDAIKEAFETAGLKSYNYDSSIYEAANLPVTPLNKSPYYIRLMQRNYEATNDEWLNYTRTTAIQAQTDFINACDKAYNLTMSGATSYSDAIAEAIEDFGAKGVTVYYPSGHTDTLETATLRAVRTGASQACADITNARMDEYEWDTILVSAHLGARVTDKEDFTNHYWWQGKFYSRSGNDTRFPPFSVCGQGNVQGINGANCRHSYGPSDGKFNPYKHYDSEENKKAYDLSQRQRELERRIRKTKRELTALKTGVEECEDRETAEKLKVKYDRKKAVLDRQWDGYNQFCKDNNLKPLYDRINVAGYSNKAPQIEAKENTAISVGDGLTEKEESAIVDYISSKSYNINAKLRTNETLTSDDTEFIKNLDYGITKLPDYQGIVYRSISSEYIEDIEKFNELHQIGRYVQYPAYTSAGKVVYDELLDIQYVIISKYGKDISKWNEAEQEVIFKRESMFYITNRIGNTIYMEEI